MGRTGETIRKIATIELLSARRIEMFSDIREFEVKLAVKEIYNKSNKLNGVVKMEMKEWFANLIMNIMVKILFGVQYIDNDNKERSKAHKAIRRFVEKALKETAKEIDCLGEEWLVEHKRKRKLRVNKSGDEEDFMDVMLSICEDKDLPGGFDADTIIKATCMDADRRLSVLERSSRTLDRGEAGVHEGGGLEAQGSTGSRADPVDFIEKYGVQHYCSIYRENRSVADHINEFNMIVSQLCFMDINFEDEIKALILMSSLPESWDTVVAAISSSRGSEKLKFDEIRDCGQPVESWILDSAKTFKSENFGKAYLVDNKPLVIKGKGDFCIETPAGNQWTLEDVRYIPGLKKNLISVGQLDSTGFVAEFRKGSWKIMKGAMVVARGTKSGTLYTTTWYINMAVVVEGASGLFLWHNRLGHMSAKGMEMLAAKGDLKGVKSVDMGLCESCVMGKQKRGISSVSSLGGSRFYVTFINDFSRKVWVYFMKHKSDMFATFKRWKAEVENQIGLKIKCLRSDNEGEYDK
ncbi:putative cytochrome 82A3-like [Capsicum annuum]|nr:putative cytochrome 82A3-like [Capsicum annuum]